MSSTDRFLPPLSDAVLNRKYEFSGITPPMAYVYMLLGLIITPITNILAWLLFWLIVTVVVVITGILAIIPLLITQLFAIVVVIAIAIGTFLSPAIVGAAVGYVEAYIGRFGKCRSPVIGGIAGAVAGFVGALPSLIIITVVAMTDTGTEETPWAVIPIMLCCVGGFFAAGGALGGYWGIQEGVFCEACETWYDGWRPAVGFDIKLAKPLAYALNDQLDEIGAYGEGVLVESEYVDRVVGEHYPNIVLTTRRCKNCPEADVQWKATFNWKKDKSEEWFVIMLPVGFSRRLERDLFESPLVRPVSQITSGGSMMV
jgi:hypothetical protein